VVANLVGNGLAHGEEPVTVTVAASEQSITVAVDDSGPGIPADHIDHVFERFYKADPSRSRGGGSGLGLAIARENAHLHGGDIAVETMLGRGSRFTFTLPRRSAPPPEADTHEGD